MEHVAGQARAAFLCSDGTRLPSSVDNFIEFTNKRKNPQEESAALHFLNAQEKSSLIAD
jgi:hypothetical protein